MAHQQNLLDEGSILDLIEDVTVKQETFKGDEDKEITFNSFTLVLTNGTEVPLRLQKGQAREVRAALYLAYVESQK